MIKYRSHSHLRDSGNLRIFGWTIYRPVKSLLNFALLADLDPAAIWLNYHARKFYLSTTIQRFSHLETDGNQIKDVELGKKETSESP